MFKVEEGKGEVGGKARLRTHLDRQRYMYRERPDVRVRIRKRHEEYTLDRRLRRAITELPVNEDASREVDLPLERRRIELMNEIRHFCLLLSLRKIFWYSRAV